MNDDDEFEVDLAQPPPMSDEEFERLQALPPEKRDALDEDTKRRYLHTSRHKFYQRQNDFSLDGMVIGGKSVDEYLAPDKDNDNATQEGQEGAQQ